MDDPNPESDGVFAMTVSLYDHISVNLMVISQVCPVEEHHPWVSCGGTQRSDEEFTSGACAASVPSRHRNPFTLIARGVGRLLQM
jgi:hypothetical protein